MFRTRFNSKLKNRVILLGISLILSAVFQSPRLFVSAYTEEKCLDDSVYISENETPDFPDVLLEPEQEEQDTQEEDNTLNSTPFFTPQVLNLEKSLLPISSTLYQDILHNTLLQSAVMTQRSYRWQYSVDEVVETMPADSVFRGVKKGELLALRLQVDNGGKISSGDTSYILQYAEKGSVNCDRKLGWRNITNSTPISYSETSENNIILPQTDVRKSCESGRCDEFIQGSWATEKTTVNILSNHFTELGFTLDTKNAVSESTYCFRVVQVVEDKVQELNGKYVNYPELVLLTEIEKKFRKDLKTNKLPEIKTDTTNFQTTESPQFDLEYFELTEVTEPYIKDVVEENRVFEEGDFRIVSDVYNHNGQKTDIIPQITFIPDGHVFIEIPQQNELTPGRYTLKVEVEEKEYANFFLEQDFTWGVLAINTNKAAYLLGENIGFLITVLDDNGMTVCNTDVLLDVTSPSGIQSAFTTSDGAITNLEECSSVNILDAPCYFMELSNVTEIGVYTMGMTAITPNGERGLIDKLEVIEKVSLPEKNSVPIDFPYTDDNSDEDLIIRTDKKDYLGLATADIYFSITNTKSDSESVNIQAHFPKDRGTVGQVERWEESIPYETDVSEFGEQVVDCETGWEKVEPTEEVIYEMNDSEEQITRRIIDTESFVGFRCLSTDEEQLCDSLSDDKKECIISNVYLGSYKETKYKSDWTSLDFSKRNEVQEVHVSDKATEKREFVTQHLQPEMQSEYIIGGGETQHFKMKIDFPVNSGGEFYIEAIGDKGGYGLLDPWWNSSWTSRKPITIDHDRVGIISDLSSSASSGQTQIVVKDGSLFVASETVVIKDDNNEETGTISSVSSNTLTMQSNLTNTYTTGASAFVKNTTDSVNLSSFPVLINLSSDTSLAAYAQNDGDDIAFTSSDETTQIDHEVEGFNGTTGELQAWVEVPTLSTSSDTILYMYYGNSTCSSQEDVTGTWDSNHKLVHHLNDWTTSTTEDSTSNSNDATKRAANEPIEAAGKIGKAQSFDGSNDYDKITNTVITSPTSLTISSWIKKESGGVGTYECALHHGSDTTIGNSSYWLGVCTSDYITATIGARTGAGWAAGQTTTTATYGQWYHLVASWNGTVVKVYIDGVYNKQYALTSYQNLTTPTRFGASADGTNYQFGGVVDEMRISTTARGLDWIKTGYNNQNAPSSFYSVGAEVGLSAPDLHDVPFDNEEIPDTTPSFEFTAEDPVGTSDLVYQIEWDDNNSFSSPTTKTSDTDAGFINTENGSDTNPFTEDQRIRFTIQAGDALSNSAANTSYYWRVRAKNNGGSFGAWANTNSLRVDSSLSTSQWTQTVDEQFDTDTLTDTETSGSDDVELSTGADIKSAQGTFTTPASTGNNSVTGVGFQPKAVMFYAVPRTDENAGSHASQFVGFSDGTRHKSSSIKSEDSVNDTGRAQQNAAIYLRNIDATNLAVATVNSFDSDGFTLNYTTTNSGYVIHYVAFGGDDLSAYVGEKIVSGSPLSGLSFAPDLMFLSTTGWTTPATDDTHGISSFGVVDDSSHWYLGTHQGSNTTTKDGRLRDDGCLTQAYNNGVTWEMTACTLTSDGMSWNGTNGDEFNYLALNFDGKSTKVDTFFKETTGTTGATQDLTGWGFTEDAAIVGFASAGKTDELFSDHVRVTMGAYDGTNQGMITFNDTNGSTASDSIQNNDYAIGIAESNATIVAAGTVSQLDEDGARITWSPNNTTAYNIGYWAIEEGTGDTASGSITSTEIDYDWVSNAYSWDELSWNDVETNGDLKYQLQYWDGDSWELIPDGSLSGNSTGFDTSPVDISGLNTTPYNQIKIKANLTNSGGTPTLQDWTVSWVPNTAPNNPTSLSQMKTDDTVVVVADWTDETSVKFGASASDTDNPDVLALCIETDPVGTAFSNAEDSCGTGVNYSGTAVTVNHTLSGLTQGGEYHWQARVRDEVGAYSSWVSFETNAETERDFGIDTTASDVGTVYDGDTIGSDDDENDGSLTIVESNWSGFTDSQSGVKKYQYAIGTTAGGTDIVNWKDKAEPGNLFSDEFESGNLSAWDATAIDVDDLYASTNASYMGLYGLTVNIDDGTSIYVEDDNSGNHDYYVRFYLNPNNLTMASGDTFTIIDMRDNSTIAASVELNYDGSNYRVRGIMETGPQTTSWINIGSSSWTSVELFWFINSSAYVSLWVDGVQYDTSTGDTTGFLEVDNFQIGMISDRDAGTSGAFYIDSITSGDAGYLGPLTYCKETITTAGHLHTGQDYFTAVRAVNNVETTGSSGNSDGISVLPTFTFSVDSSSINFLTLDPGNAWTDTQTTQTTASTNVYNGYIATLWNTQNFTNTLDNSYTIPNYSGTNASPTTWSGNAFGYTTNDDNLSGGTTNRFTSGGPNYAGFVFNGAGDPVCDHGTQITGTTGALSNEHFTITYRVTVDMVQAAGPYATTIVYIATPRF